MHIAYDHHHLLKSSSRLEVPLLEAALFIIRDAFGSMWCQRGSSSWGHTVAVILYNPSQASTTPKVGLASESRISAPAPLPPWL